MSRTLPMPRRITHSPFGEADLERDEPDAPASRCSYPPPTVTLELEIDRELLASFRETEPERALPRDTQPEQQRPTSPEADARVSDPHSIEEALHRATTVRPGAPATASTLATSTPATIEEALLRLIETRPRLVPKA